MDGLTALAVALGTLFAVGATRAVQTHAFVRRAVRVRAKVVEVLDASVGNPDTGTQTSPTSRFVVDIPGQGARARRVTLADAFGGSIADRFVADDGTIAVMYDRSKPDVVRIDSPWALYFAPLFLCAPGVLFLALIVYLWLGT